MVVHKDGIPIQTSMEKNLSVEVTKERSICFMNQYNFYLELTG